jgi:23S rRNA (uracil1939-C5)-methyltransferase
MFAGMLQKNQIVRLAITDLTHEGNGVGHVDGLAVFVPRTTPGDEADVKIVQVRGSYAYGIVEKLVTPSTHRVENDCPVFSRCGGCTLRHLSYEAELAAKEEWVKSNLRRIGKIELNWDHILPSPQISRYRNKAQYPIRMVDGRVRAGFFAPRSHRLIPVEDCKLQPLYFSKICGEVCAFAEEKNIPPYDEQTGSGLLRHLFLRWGETTQQTLVCLVLNGNTFPHAQELAQRLEPLCPGEMTLCLSVNTRRDNVILGDNMQVVTGSGRILDKLGGVKLSLSPFSFYQVNRKAAELLYQVAREYAGLEETAPKLLLDLYCGVGAIGLSMASGAEQVIGVESVPAAIEDAKENAVRNGIRNIKFLCADAADAAAHLQQQGLRPEVVVVDPPRKGVAGSALKDIVAMNPQRIVYVSCNSATLARDCRILTDCGYQAVRGRAVDLFPRTAHVECVTLMSKVEK